VGGGSINEAYRVRSGEETYFCKVNSATKFPQLFRTEKAGLELIESQGIIRTPRILDLIENNERQLLVLEWIEPGERTTAFWTRFGEQLAQLHKVTREQHGLDEDNYMGSVPQRNTPATNWTTFFRDHRLMPLVEECRRRNLLHSRHEQSFEKLYRRLPAIFEEEKPSLLHGDLWSGNFMCGSNSQPVLIDPAVYFGHRSMDLGMTTLFGGFRQPFYEAYHHHYPFPSNYEEQWSVCNLYPLLIHVLLFGSSYRSQVEEIVGRY
jgi:protein-ribulosamine 3-kinase